eukprot:1534557-Ditylum_brightwellii.AAC.1
MESEGFGGVMTCRRDHLPGDISGEYLHKKKIDTSDRTKVIHYFNPVLAVKDMPAITEITKDADGNGIEKEVSKSYQRGHASFQSTSLYNFSTVNALNKCKTASMIKSRGRDDNKRYWEVEMNDAWQFYLKTYGVIDTIDHCLKNTRLGYVCWKYWHSPMLHGTVLATLVAYDCYKEVYEGDLDPVWTNNDTADYWTFCDIITTQMCHYNPIHCLYLGDGHMRPSMSQNTSKRKASETAGAAARAIMSPTRKKYGHTSTSPSFQSHPNKDSLVKHFKDAETKHGANFRLGGNLKDLKIHLSSAVTAKKYPKEFR